MQNNGKVQYKNNGPYSLALGDKGWPLRDEMSDEQPINKRPRPLELHQKASNNHIQVIFHPCIASPMVNVRSSQHASKP